MAGGAHNRTSHLDRCCGVPASSAFASPFVPYAVRIEDAVIGARVENRRILASGCPGGDAVGAVEVGAVEDLLGRPGQLTSSSPDLLMTLYRMKGSPVAPKPCWRSQRMTSCAIGERCRSPIQT
jgi:hypothetical protein